MNSLIPMPRYKQSTESQKQHASLVWCKEIKWNEIYSQISKHHCNLSVQTCAWHTGPINVVIITENRSSLQTTIHVATYEFNVKPQGLLWKKQFILREAGQNGCANIICKIFEFTFNTVLIVNILKGQDHDF